MTFIAFFNNMTFIVILYIALLIIGYIKFAQPYTKSRHRTGFRIRSWDDIDSNNDPLLRKIDRQVDIVGRQADKFNYASLWFIGAGCYIHPVDQARITLAAQNAHAQGLLAAFGYKILPKGRVCYISSRYNTTVRSYSNLHALVKNFG